MFRRPGAMVAGACMILMGARAGADIPSPSASYVEPCIVTCPAGDSMFTTIVRHFTNDPFINSTVVVDLCNCPGLLFVPPSEESGYDLQNECSARTSTDLNGVADMGLELGGVCSGHEIRIYADGVLLAIRSVVASFDQNADGSVTVADLALVDGKLGTNDLTADFDCDGAVTSLDHHLAVTHLGHSSSVPLAVGHAPSLRLSATPIPNPGRGRVEFVLQVPIGGHASLSVHDLTGRRVSNVLELDLPAGIHRAAWSGRDESGRSVSPGLYFYRFSVGGEVARGTVVVRS